MGVPGAPLGGPLGSRGGPWAARRGPWELPWDTLGVQWGSMGCSRWRLNGVFSFLGRPGDGFRENPGNSGSHSDSILDDFLMIFRDIFGLRFLNDF